MLDHPSAQELLQRLIAGRAPMEGDLDEVLAQVATCEECDRQFELDRTAACEEVEDDLPDSARMLREGRDVAESHPALARHAQECERSRIILAELASEVEFPVGAPAGRRAEVGEAQGGARPEALAIADVPVELHELRELALAAALYAPDPVARERVAERLGRSERLGTGALAALAEVAAEDEDDEVRAVALRALDELDATVSIPERVIEAWAAEPEEAAPFIAGVLARLAKKPMPIEGITEFVGVPTSQDEQMAFTGEGGITGQVTEEEGELRLSLDGLPPKFEHTKPIVAIPTALQQTGEPSLTWSGTQPGLVPATEEVSGGSLEVSLGRIGKGASTRKKDLFNLVYLLEEEPRAGDRRGD